LTSPGPTTASSDVVLSWTASSGATSHGLGVRDIGTGILVVNTTVTSGTSYTANLSAGTQYRWNVDACKTSGCSGFTAVLYFQTPAGVPGGVPAAFTLTGSAGCWAGDSLNPAGPKKRPCVDLSQEALHSPLHREEHSIKTMQRVPLRERRRYGG